MKKSEQTKAAILASAAEVAAEKGYSATTTREIAKRAGISEATIFKYYRTKDDLLEQIVVQTIEQFYDYTVTDALPHTFALGKDKSATFLLRELLRERISFLRSNTPAIRLILQEMMINESVERLLRDKIWAQMRSTLDQVLQIGKESGQFKDIKNEAFQKAVIGTMLYAIFESALGFASSDGPDVAEDELDAVLDILLYGIKED